MEWTDDTKAALDDMFDRPWEAESADLIDGAERLQSEMTSWETHRGERWMIGLVSLLCKRLSDLEKAFETHRSLIFQITDDRTRRVARLEQYLFPRAAPLAPGEVRAATLDCRREEKLIVIRATSALGTTVEITLGKYAAEAFARNIEELCGDIPIEI